MFLNVYNVPKPICVPVTTIVISVNRENWSLKVRQTKVYAISNFTHGIRQLHSEGIVEH